ncbi:nitronate monooxygenase [Chryseolinea sp. T2]|uniref:NAD(P)H-dependent flavin oxidoreductase n=1 Tax=Chryseolinea sp. T2 TaxID=3129255 RepID=UPI0030784B3B
MKADTHRITSLFQISYPIIQAGMVWCSGWKLASAVSNAGGLGIIGSGSMSPDLLREHIIKCKSATTKPFAVNLPLLYSGIDKLIDVVVGEGVRIVFTSAGNPATWTSHLKSKGISVVHVVSSSKFARKAEASGVDAVVAEGFEAGGHNGREETTTFVLVPLVKASVNIPVIAAGGIGSGSAMLAAEALGADGFQIGSLFAASQESSSHENFKERITNSEEGDTVLTLKQLTPVRLIRNAFYQRVAEAELRGASKDELATLLGKRRSKLGIFDGDLDEGELEIGQIAAAIKAIKPAKQIVEELWQEYRTAKERLASV